jgi:hypothetical protein
VSPPVLPRLAPHPSARHSTSGLCSAAKSVASPPALPPTNCPILPWAWSQAGSDAFPPPLRGVADGWPLRPRGTAETGQGFGRFIAPPRRVGSASDAWPCRALAPRGFGPVRPARGRAPRGPHLPPTRWPPEGGCAAGSSACRARRLGRTEGRARLIPLPAACAVWPPARGSVAFRLPMAPGPCGSVAAVRDSRGSLSPWFGARWVRRRSAGARWVLLPWFGARGSVPVVRGARRHPSPWFGAVGPSTWFGGSWVRLAVRGARRRPSPWSGPVDPSAAGRGPGGSFAAVRGARRRPSPWFGARWVRPRGSGVRESLRLGSGSGWSLCSGSGLPGEPFSFALGPLDPSAAGRGSRRSLSHWLGGPWFPPPRVVGPMGPSRGSGRPKASVPVVGARWVRRRGSGSRGSVTAGRGRGVRRAVRGARKRPSPWSGLRGSVAVARDPWIPSLGPGSGRSLA